MTIIKFILILLLFFVLSGCAVSPDPPLPTLTPLPPTQATLTATQGSGDPGAGDVTLVLRSNSVPNHYGLARLSGRCLLETIPCTVEVIPGFPETEYSTAPFAWSPNGRYAAFHNSYTNQLIEYSPQTGKFTVIADHFSMIEDEIYWSPDGKTAAVAFQGDDPYSSKIVLIDFENQKLKELTANLDGGVHILGWRMGNLILFSLRQYGFQGANSSGKKGITGLVLGQIDAQSGAIAEVAPAILWLERESLSLSPDGNSLASASQAIEDRLYILDLNTLQESQIFTPKMFPHWSPDGRSLAGVFNKRKENGEISKVLTIVRIDGTQPSLSRELASDPTVSWFPDSAHLLLSYLDGGGSEPGGSVDVLTLPDGVLEHFPLSLGDTPRILEVSWEPALK